ncbi:MAG TPA: ribonucleoside-diphosphate reductase subunit alpha [Alphaproteobacteria bacterium]|nr:ribonucleoside-diphosphate reductase subunit alpha [Alphaproteobacteria bacterium]
MNETMCIVKRNGTVVPYDSAKIRNAILKAVKAIGSKIEDQVLDQLVEHIEKEIELRFTDMYPNVENVQDIVEKHLVENGLYQIAKEYIVYRAERNRVRQEEQKANIEKSVLGKLKVQKKNGSTVLFDTTKLKDTITRASKGFEKEISENLIVKEVLKNVYDGITTEDIEKALILSTNIFIEKDPAYSKVSARIYLQRLYKEVMGVSVDNQTIQNNYKESFVKNINLAIEVKLLDERMKLFDLKILADHLRPERDDLFEYIGVQTLYERYFMKHNGKRIELPQAFWMRVAMGLAISETDRNSKAIEFYETISQFYFTPSTPTLFHSGTSHPQLSSCYLTTVQDDLKDIFKAYSDNAMLSKWSGGLGNDWTNIRATGARIKTTNVESQGVIPFLKIANDVTAAINRSGKRRGATCAYLETWHLDIEEFLDLRKNTGDDRRRTHDMNTSNWIPDLFMKRVVADENWTLFSPEEVPELHHIYGSEFQKKYEDYELKAQNGGIKKHKIVSARKLWRKMITMLFETGHPWITFKDPCNIRSPQDHAGTIHSSNLCTEITLNTSKDEIAVCNLGSINIVRHVKNGRLDEEQIAKTVASAVRMLDNVIDINYYPTPEAENSNLKHRPVGMGIMAVQDALFELNIPFDSPKALQFSDSSMELISYHAILASSQLAKERGTYSSYVGSKWDRGIFPIDTISILERERGEQIPINRDERLDWSVVRAHVKQYGMRNSNVMAIAPTATISTIVNCYPCIEPIYKNIYVKSNMSGEFTIVNSYLIADLKKHNLWSDEMLEQLKYYDGNISLIAGIPQEIKDKYKEVFDIDPRILNKHTALRGKWIDQSQSHNIFYKGTSGSAISDIYIHAWQLGLKTTYYLRTMGASQIEKSTLDTKYGFTQNRDQGTLGSVLSKEDASIMATAAPVFKACLIDNPDCEACQ